MSLLVEGHWLPVRESDLRVAALYRRHYSWGKNGRPRVHRLGPGAKMVLLTEACDAFWLWRRERYRRDHQDGVCCAVFRNESPSLSSDLIREADALADTRWPGERHFTYVDPAAVASRNPGYCFLKAGWRRCGTNKDGRLVLLERSP